MIIRIDQSQVYALGRDSDDVVGNRQECVGSLPRVSGVCQDGASEFAGGRPRLVGRLLRIAERLARRLDDAKGARWEFARRFAEGIWKLARNTSGDHQRKTMRLAAVEFGGC
ncbi:hypothetical protein BHM03_00052509 [Ensete ventricosum]|nr:hypothetical protein BHM03_00052509 [Ensete ventricosum]